MNRSQNANDQKLINSFVEMIERSIGVRDFELGGGIIKFTRHDGFTFSTSIPCESKRRLFMKFEVK